MKNLVVILILTGFVGVAHGSIAKTSYTLPDPNSSGPALLTDDQWQAESKAAQERGKRTVAATDSIDEKTALSQNFRDIRDELNGGGKFPGITTAEALDAFLIKIDDDKFYATQAPDAQLAIAQLSTLRVWRSFYNRSMELMGKSSFTHSMVVSVLRLVATGVNVYLPTDQWKAGIKYVSMPVEGAEPSPKQYPSFNCHHADPRAPKTSKYAQIPNYCSDLRTDRDFQEFLYLELIPVLERAAGRIAKLNFKDRGVYWDNQFAFGKTANFSDDHDRFLIFSEAERHSLLSAYYAGLSALCSVSAYNLDGFFEVWEKIGRLYGVGGIFLPDVANAKTRTGFIMAENQSRGFLKINGNAKGWLTAAFKYLKASVQQADLSWGELKTASANSISDRAILDPRVFTPYGRVINLSLSNMKSLLSDKNHQEVGSAVFGNERIDVKVSALFDGNTAPTNLCEFLPTPNGFNGEAYRMTVPFHGVSREVHNYYSGMPTDWNYGAYGKYFSNVNDAEGVKRAARILSQTWGGWVIGLPMAALVL